MNRGSVKIYRCIEDDPIWQDDEPYSKRAAWIDLILQVNHKDSSFILGMQKIIVKRGQKWTSIGKLCERWHWGREKVSRYLNLLESEGMIWQERTNRGLLITLVNYAKFQDFNGRATEPLTVPLDVQREGLMPNEGRTTDRATDLQTIMNKNDIKNESKNVKKPAALSLDFVVEE